LITNYRQLIENNPALLYEDFFPAESPWPEIAELREMHVRLLGERVRTAQALSELSREFAAEDERRKTALTNAIYADAKPDLPEITPDDERAAAIREAQDEAEAANEALGRFLDGALSWLAENDAALQGVLDERGARIEEERLEARRLLAVANEKAREFVPLRAWLGRAVGGNSGVHVAFGHLEAPPPEEPFEDRLARIHAGEVANA
jgi:hypothetical protein